MKIINQFTTYKEILEIQNSLQKNKEIIKQFIVKWAYARGKLLERFRESFEQKDGHLIGYALMIEFLKTNHKEGLGAFFPNLLAPEKDEAVALAMKIYREITTLT